MPPCGFIRPFSYRINHSIIAHALRHNLTIVFKWANLLFNLLHFLNSFCSLSVIICSGMTMYCQNFPEQFAILQFKKHSGDQIAYALRRYLTIFLQLSLFLVIYPKNISGGKITAQCVGGLTGKFFSKKRKDNCTDGAERKDNCRKDNCAGGVFP